MTNFKAPTKEELAERMRPLSVYHAIIGASESQAFNLFPDASKNILLAASMMTLHKAWKKNLSLIRAKAKSLFADSGMIGFSRRLGKGCRQYALHPETVFDIQLQLDPDIIAHLDIPCEPTTIEAVGLSVQDAMDLTVKNAAYLVERKVKGDPRLKRKTIAIGIQGREVDDYMRCFNRYRELGFDSLPASDYIFAIGSLVVKRPPELFEIVEQIRTMIPDKYRVHCYGIAKVSWMLQLEQMGVSSCDNSSANFASAMAKYIGEEGFQRSLNYRHQNKWMKAALFAYNMASMGHQLKQKNYPIVEELFFDHYEQMGLDG